MVVRLTLCLRIKYCIIINYNRDDTNMYQQVVKVLKYINLKQCIRIVRKTKKKTKQKKGKLNKEDYCNFERLNLKTCKLIKPKKNIEFDCNKLEKLKIFSFFLNKN